MAASAQTGTPEAAEKRVIIRTIGMKKLYRKGGQETAALRGVDVEIYTGEFISVMGPSGSGKSTFFNMIGALDSPSEGRVFIDEVDVAQLTAEELAFLRCRKIGYIFQSYNLIKYMTALENVTTPMAFGGVPDDDARKRGMEILGLVGLRERWFHRPIEMSGGQQQRVAIARALVHDPTLVLADEPTGNLDENTGRAVLALLDRLTRQAGKNLLMVTHSLESAAWADRVFHLRDGKLEYDPAFKAGFVTAAGAWPPAAPSLARNPGRAGRIVRELLS